MYTYILIMQVKNIFCYLSENTKQLGVCIAVKIFKLYLIYFIRNVAQTNHL